MALNPLTDKGRIFKKGLDLTLNYVHSDEFCDFNHNLSNMGCNISVGQNSSEMFQFKVEQDCLLQGQAQLDQRFVFRFSTLRLRLKKAYP